MEAGIFWGDSKYVFAGERVGESGGKESGFQGMQE